jgi:hypothetical protein
LRTEVREQRVTAPEGVVAGEWLRRELRDIVTEVMMSRVLRVVERRRGGERRSVALRGRSWRLGHRGGQVGKED